MGARQGIGVTALALATGFWAATAFATGQERLELAVLAAFAEAPALVADQAENAADHARIWAETAGLAPYAEWQSEGFGPGLDRRQNAQDTLRFGTTLEPFWSLGRRGAVRDAADRRAEWRASALRSEIGWRVTELWVESAALIEQRELAERRLKRMERAIEQQRKRFELGEISGSELLQFEAILAEYRATRADVDARWRGQWAALVSLIGREVPPPQAGDLADLAGNATGALPDVAGAPPVVAAETAAEVERARSDWLAAAAWGRPTLELEWERFPGLEGLPGYDAWGLRVNVPLPIGGAGAHEREAARAAARASEARFEATSREASARLAALEARAEAAEASLEAVRELAAGLDGAEHSLGEQYRLGELDYVGLLDGLDRIDGMRRAQIEARRAMVLARQEAVWLTGGPAWVEVGPGPAGDEEE